MSITNDRKAELIAEFGSNDKDSGSAAVQVAILTERIVNLTEHAEDPQEGFRARAAGLLMTMVGRRRHLLDYIKRRDADAYKATDCVNSACVATAA